jgi:hypothetical protein
MLGLNDFSLELVMADMPCYRDLGRAIAAGQSGSEKQVQVCPSEAVALCRFGAQP